MHAVVFTQAARAEIIEAQDWYESERQGLGRRFLSALDEVQKQVSANPLQFPFVHRQVRRALFKTFPYALMFVTDEEQTVTVLACFHASVTHASGKANHRRLTQ